MHWGGGVLCRCVLQGAVPAVPCPKGTYRPTPGATSSADCQQIPAGQYGDVEGAIAPSGFCSVGYYCPAGSTSATARICPAGNVSARHTSCP